MENKKFYGGNNFNKFNTNAAENVNNAAVEATVNTSSNVATETAVKQGIMTRAWSSVKDKLSAFVEKPAGKAALVAGVVVTAAEVGPKIFTGKWGHEYIPNPFGKKTAESDEEVVEVVEQPADQEFESVAE